MGSCLYVALLENWLICLVFDRVNHFLHRVDNFFARDDDFLHRCWVTSVSGSLDLNNKAGVLVRRVLDSAGGAVRLHQAVVPLHLVTITLLVLLLDVMCVLVFHAVFEFVVRGYL